MLISRRRMLAAGGAGLTGLVAAAPLRAAEQLAFTVNQTIGPFYPVERPLDQDADLTIVRGRRGAAKGQVIEVSGRVLDPDGRPIPGARIDLWQANAAGRYAHPGDKNPAPLDPDFQGSARLVADGEGRYRFRTIRPGAYEDRTPHIHFDVIGRSQRAVTQMYFPNEPLNLSDVLFSRVPEGPYRDRLVARALPGAAAAFEWDIVLATG